MDVPKTLVSAEFIGDSLWDSADTRCRRLPTFPV